MYLDFELTEEDRKAIRRLDTGKLKVDHNNPVLAKFLLDYDKNFNPDNRYGLLKESGIQHITNKESTDIYHRYSLAFYLFTDEHSFSSHLPKNSSTLVCRLASVGA